MKYILPLLLLLSAAACSADAQSLFVAGPMPGYTELRTAKIWTEVAPTVKTLSIRWWPAGKDKSGERSMAFDGVLGKDFNPATFTLTGLEPGQQYQYEINAADNKKGMSQHTGTFTTQALWQFDRLPGPPDFSFLTGSCAYFNQPQYDRPGKPYGGDSSIFLTMAKQPAGFMLWLGDNWYTREVDYGSTWGLRYRAHHDRSSPVLQPLLRAMPHYAIWDDHDFGPNDYGSSYIYTGEGRSMFADYWPNPSFGRDGKGIYTQFNFNDVPFFLLDDRTWRSEDDTRDSIGGKPNADKKMLGREQLTWLENALLFQKNAPFKIIANGSQVLNPRSPYECLRHCPAEWQELMGFIAQYNIGGVVFLSGDRHHSEIIRLERAGDYPLYDITISPLTSGPAKPAKEEEGMPERVAGTLITEQNFARISVSGAKGARVLKVLFLDKAGVEKGTWEAGENDLRRKAR